MRDWRRWCWIWRVEGSAKEAEEGLGGSGGVVGVAPFKVTVAAVVDIGGGCGGDVSGLDCCWAACWWRAVVVESSRELFRVRMGAAG